MTANRYLHAVLTIIALELGWIAITHTPGVSAQAAQAQQGPAPTRVIITGVDFAGQAGYLPVGIVGAVNNVPQQVRQTLDPAGVRVQSGRPLQVDSQQPVTVRMTGTVKVETDRPLKVENIGATASPRPGL
jgi:hypothetical protein